MCPGSVCVLYAKPWPHSIIRSCCPQSPPGMILYIWYDSMHRIIPEGDWRQQDLITEHSKIDSFNMG